MVTLFRDLGVEWFAEPPFPDYYPHLPGAAQGRVLNCETMDGKRLGDALKTMRKSVNYPPLVFSINQMAALLAPFRTVGHLATLVQILGTTLRWRLLGKVPLSMGRALMGQLRLAAQKFDTPILLEAEMRKLVVESGRVVGVEFEHNGETRSIRATNGVLLAAGGFAQNADFRRKHQAVGRDYTAAAVGDTGTAITAADEIGADLALLEESWWMPVVILPDGRRSIVLWERAMPHSIIVDRQGHRYMNEAQPYNDCGRRILECEGDNHSWLILDSRHRRNYAFNTLPPRYTPQNWLDKTLIKAGSLEDLAEKIAIDPAILIETITRFNRLAEAGKDTDFGRGGNIYDNCWGDFTYTPNPNLGTIERAPFFAAPIWPGDIGTKGGILTDEFGRVVSKQGKTIPGLYAAGNSAASVMGPSYPGAGGTLGPAMVFAYIAMQHAAGADRRNSYPD